jgi:hypothetical protein
VSLLALLSSAAFTTALQRHKFGAMDVLVTSSKRVGNGYILVNYNTSFEFEFHYECLAVLRTTAKAKTKSDTPAWARKG